MMRLSTGPACAGELPTHQVRGTDLLIAPDRSHVTRDPISGQFHDGEKQRPHLQWGGPNLRNDARPMVARGLFDICEH